jgi:uridine phosphorylase
VGITATAPGFFGAQGRPIPQLPIRYPDLAEDMARQRVMNFEMEASALLVLAGLARCRAGVVCAVYAQRTTGDFVTGAAKDKAEAACVETGLESLLILAEMDRQKQEPGRTAGGRPSGTDRDLRHGLRSRDATLDRGGFSMAEAYCVKDR